jgi:hypothetical protein
MFGTHDALLFEFDLSLLHYFTEARDQGSGVRDQEPKTKNPEQGKRKEGSEVRDQKSDVSE